MAPASPRLTNVEKADPNAFEYGEKLGSGSFGTVYRVVHKATGESFAMKILLRKKVEKANLMRYALTERNVMSYARHPYVVSLRYAFQTQNQFVLVMQYCPGGTLQSLIKREKKLSLELSRHYAAQILLAVDYMHDQKVLYRDLKGENVVIDEDNHAMITDFGLSKEDWEEGTKAKSFLGSVCYLAPDRLTRRGHDHTVDIYGLGVLTHNMVAGKVPFFNSAKDKMWEAIKTAELVLPDDMPEDAAGFVKETMRRESKDRLGAKKTSDCQQHIFFQAVDFDALLHRKVPAPLQRQSSAQAIAVPVVSKILRGPPVNSREVFGRTNHCSRILKCWTKKPVQNWSYAGEAGTCVEKLGTN